MRCEHRSPSDGRRNHPAGCLLFYGKRPFRVHIDPTEDGYTTRMSFRRRRRRSRPSAEQRDTVHTYDVGVGFTNCEFNLFGRGVGAATAQRLPKMSLALYDGRPADHSPGGQKLAAELS
jgi:hypothetical protein